MIESTLWLHGVGVVPGLFPLLRAVQRSHMWTKENGKGDG